MASVLRFLPVLRYSTTRVNCSTVSTFYIRHSPADKSHGKAVHNTGHNRADDIHSIDSHLKRLIGSLSDNRINASVASSTLHPSSSAASPFGASSFGSHSAMDDVKTVREVIDVVDQWITICNRERKVLSLSDKLLTSFFSELCRRKEFARAEATIQRILRLRRWDMHGVIPYINIFNVYLYHAARLKQFDDTVRVFVMMQDNGLSPNARTLLVMAQVYRMKRQPGRAISLLESFRQSPSFEFRTPLLNFLIELYREQSYLAGVVNVLSDLILRRKMNIADEVTYSITVKAFAEHGKVAEVAPLLLHLQQYGPGIDRHTYSLILKAMTEGEDVMSAYRMHMMIAEKNIVLDTETLNSLLVMFVETDMVDHYFQDLIEYMEATGTLDESSGISIVRALTQKTYHIKQLIATYRSICDSAMQRKLSRLRKQQDMSLEDDRQTVEKQESESYYNPTHMEHELIISPRQFFMAAFEGYTAIEERRNGNDGSTAVDPARLVDDIAHALNLPLGEELMNDVLQAALETEEVIIAAEAVYYLLERSCFSEHTAQIIGGDAAEKVALGDAHNVIGRIGYALNEITTYMKNITDLLNQLTEKYPHNSNRFFLVLAAAIEISDTHGRMDLMDSLSEKLMTEMSAYVNHNGLTGSTASVLDAAVCTALKICARHRNVNRGQDLFLALLEVGAQPHASTVCNLALAKETIGEVIQVYDQLATQFRCKKTPHVYKSLVERCIQENAETPLRELMQEMKAAEMFLPDAILQGKALEICASSF